ncbi:hypothetical protein [Abyssisolibacter fermentans]|uniref:hypothetical protein n=1 Tax=Abyssisolibacter fermentans TaxID=1766203 RepID=UPI00082C836C|nr:hypothetical protein [Abyssisolibacter fermentans]
MVKIEYKQQNIYSIIYNKIPENHLFKQIGKVDDYSFINDMFKDNYCVYYGRPAKEPEMMIKLLNITVPI